MASTSGVVEERSAKRVSREKKETVRKQIKESGAYGAVGMYCGGGEASREREGPVTKESGAQRYPF